MYRVYLKRFNERGSSEVDPSTRTVTSSPPAAEVAFRELISRTDLLGQNVHAVLSLDNRHLMYHRFDKKSGDRDFVSPDDEIRLFHD
jgi:hypothetical protein